MLLCPHGSLESRGNSNPIESALLNKKKTQTCEYRSRSPGCRIQLCSPLGLLGTLSSSIDVRRIRAMMPPSLRRSEARLASWGLWDPHTPSVQPKGPFSSIIHARYGDSILLYFIHTTSRRHFKPVLMSLKYLDEVKTGLKIPKNVLNIFYYLRLP